MNGLSTIDEAGIARLVHAFYARVRADAELGPIFNDAIEDWPGHLEKLAAFWSSVMLTSGRYKGQPVPAHLKHKSRIPPALFDRWPCSSFRQERPQKKSLPQSEVRPIVAPRDLRNGRSCRCAELAQC